MKHLVLHTNMFPYRVLVLNSHPRSRRKGRAKKLLTFFSQRLWSVNVIIGEQRADKTGAVSRVRVCECPCLWVHLLFVLPVLELHICTQ